MTSEKSKTNKKWTSNQDYKDNYDRIFGNKDKAKVSDESADKVCERCDGKGLIDTRTQEDPLGSDLCPDCKSSKE